MLNLLTRFLQMLFIIAVLSVALFGLLSAMPGNPVDMLITSNPKVKPEDVVRLKKLRGLDQPWYVQYVRWIWGYYDPLQPPVVDAIKAIEAKIEKGKDTVVRVDLSGSIHDSDVHLSKDELFGYLKSNPKALAEVTPFFHDMQKSEDEQVNLAMEKLLNDDYENYLSVAKVLAQKEVGQLKVRGLFGASAAGPVLTQVFRTSGEYRIWFTVTDAKGLQTVGSVPIVIKNAIGKVSEKGIAIVPLSSQVVDDPKTFKVDLASSIADLKPDEKGQYQFRLEGSPGFIDSNGVYHHEFKSPGQTAIFYRILDASGKSAYGAFSVEHGPLPDKSRFNRGFLFFFTGDKAALGFSVTYKRPVWELLSGPPSESLTSSEPKSFWEKTNATITSWLTHSGRVGNTLQLMLPAILISLLIALPIGILSAYRQYSWFDYSVNFFAFIGISLPVFWFAIMVMYLFAEQLQLFPAGGVQTPGIEELGLGDILLDRLEHAVLPTVVLSIAYVGRWLRYMRASMLEVLPSDYIRTARAKGLSELTVIAKHAVRNALIPVVTVLSMSIPALFGGAVLTETVFSWPGIGRLQYDAVMNSDYYVAIVVFLISAMLVMFGNLLADMMYILVDPRIRKS